MTQDDFKRFLPDDLRTYMSQEKEKDYVLIDVRQPAEYQDGHIPGALLIPLGEMERRLFELPSDRDLVFYCRSGGRSAAAATLAVDAEVTEKSVAHLEGGMLGWDGHTLTGYPRIQIFDPAAALPDLLKAAIDLEKGAWRFYSEVVSKHPNAPFTPVFKDLSFAEIGHARVVYRFWKHSVPDAPSFEALYDGLTGDVLEGGIDVSAAIAKIETLDDPPCMGLLEWAMHIEQSAYDLYRNTAERAANAEAKEAFLTIAQAEKAHMRSLVKALSVCGPR
ncbi:MAG: rhodanese-like domain-containing protein [Pseudomonadota bacterium]